LPPEYRTALAEGLATISLAGGAGDAQPAGTHSADVQPTCTRPGDARPLGAVLSAAQLDVIADHVRLLLAWNEAINLTAIRSPEMIAVEHVLDSLTALPILSRAGVDEFLDLGSGGGFPGLPLAVALPARRALLVESVGKKARFLATVIEATSLQDRVAVAATRIETLAADPHHRGRWPAVTVRAVAQLSELVELALPLLRIGGILVAWKRRPAEDEIAAADGAIRQLRGRLVRLQPIAVPGLEDHVLVVVEKAGETPPQFPRDPAARRRHPL
jgi:16S rRNA (guanine527-N7)-methyltransferase